MTQYRIIIDFVSLLIDQIIDHVFLFIEKESQREIA